MSILSKIEIERAIDEGRAQVLMTTGKWWKVRRNGKTHTPKRTPDAWHVPVRYGLKGYARLDISDFQHGHARIVEG